VGSSVYSLDFELNDRDSIFGRDRKGTLSATASRLALGPTKPPIQWVLRSFFLGAQRPGHETVIHLHLVRSLRQRGSTVPLPRKPS